MLTKLKDELNLKESKVFNDQENWSYQEEHS